MPEKKEKVLIVHNYYQIPGGEDTVVVNEKRLLEEHGHEVVLYTRHNSELKNMSKIRKLLIPFSTIFNLRTYREVRQILTEKKIDIVHVHNTLNLISPSVYYAGLSKKIPVVQTVHNFRLLCPGATFFRDGHVCEEVEVLEHHAHAGADGALVLGRVRDGLALEIDGARGRVLQHVHAAQERRLARARRADDLRHLLLIAGIAGVDLLLDGQKPLVGSDKRQAFDRIFHNDEL